MAPAGRDAVDLSTEQALLSPRPPGGFLASYEHDIELWMEDQAWAGVLSASSGGWGSQETLSPGLEQVDDAQCRQKVKQRERAGGPGLPGGVGRARYIQCKCSPDRHLGTHVLVPRGSCRSLASFPLLPWGSNRGSEHLPLFSWMRNPSCSLLAQSLLQRDGWLLPQDGPEEGSTGRAGA